LKDDEGVEGGEMKMMGYKPIALRSMHDVLAW